MNAHDQTVTSILRRHSRPLAPLPTDVEPRLPKLEGIRAVLFDVYGTLFISASGEVGTVDDAGSDEDAVTDALAAVGLATDLRPGEGRSLLEKIIRRFHHSARDRGIAWPEVDIVEVWRAVVDELSSGGRLPAEPITTADLELLAVEHEVRSNPVWPMPGVGECLQRLQASGLTLGLVSNAQFYTPRLFEALLDEPVDQLFPPDLQIYSYRHGRAKPDKTLLCLACDALAVRQITPAETLYVGNDMLNDMTPAGRVGFVTALFAGDVRSLRLRSGDERIGDVSPRLVVTQLKSVEECIIP